MDWTIIEHYELSDKREIELWDNSIFIFDTSALLDLYFFPNHTREKIYKEIFERLHNRLWIPYQVQYEYLKNREKTIIKPISENYAPLRSDIKKVGTLLSVDFLNQIKSISDITKNDNKHPHIEQKEIENFKKNSEKFKSDTDNFIKTILKEIEKAEKDILDITQNDDVLIALRDYFEVGRSYSFNEILDITKEGKHRYEFKIPPGYGDLINKQKKGVQIFGDLIIWKQILEFSHKKKSNIIFITNDISKDNDWCYVNKKQKDQILKPREELIKEIFDNSNVELWMYSLPQFLHNANKFLNSSIKENDINYFSNSFKQKKKRLNKEFEIPEYYKCEICEHERSNVEFHYSEYPITNQYPSKHPYSIYVSAITGNCSWCNTLYIVCPKCSGITPLTEYHYDDKIECYGGCGSLFKVDTSHDFDGIGDYDIIMLDHRIEKCACCGEDFVPNETFSDCCVKCEIEYNED